MAAPNSITGLSERIKRLEETLEYMAKDGHLRITKTEERIGKLEETSAARGERLDNFSTQVKSLENHLYRMENSLLQEFKLSQEIMKSMLDHDLSIEKAKFELKIEMERKQAELKAEQEKQEAEMMNKQRELEIEAQQQRQAFRREIWVKAGAVGLPILTALATGISLLINNYFGG